jgi:hypothetical protein
VETEIEIDAGQEIGAAIAVETEIEIEIEIEIEDWGLRMEGRGQ